MNTKNNICTKFRTWLYKILGSHLALNADWVQNHVARCPRCQRRLASVARVNLALSLLKAQPHSLDLLKRANAQAIGVLKHSLRDAPKAAVLRNIQPEPSLLERCGKYKSSLANIAACFAVLFLMKVGIFSFMSRFQSQGQKTLKNYYAANLGKDDPDSQRMLNEIFPA